MFRVFNTSSSLESSITAQAALYTALSDASFWEHRNLAGEYCGDKIAAILILRTECVVEQLLAETICYANLDMSELIQRSKGKKRSKKHEIGQDQMLRAANAFRFSQVTPASVLGRAACEELATRACAADVSLPLLEANDDLRCCFRKAITHQISSGNTLVCNISQDAGTLLMDGSAGACYRFSG
jgi:hypothetical protein